MNAESAVYRVQQVLKGRRVHLGAVALLVLAHYEFARCNKPMGEREQAAQTQLWSASQDDGSLGASTHTEESGLHRASRGTRRGD